MDLNISTVQQFGFILLCRTYIEENISTSAEVKIKLLKKFETKIKFMSFHAVLLSKTYPLMYHLLLLTSVHAISFTDSIQEYCQYTEGVNGTLMDIPTRSKCSKM